MILILYFLNISASICLKVDFPQDLLKYATESARVKDTIIIGNKEGEWATYDFTDDMRNFQVGVGVGLDWYWSKSLGVSAELNWGLTGVFKSDFKTVEQTLYPLYGCVSVFYKIN